MLPRERVLQSIAHQQPDRIPVDYWAETTVTDRLAHHYCVPTPDALLQRLGVDLRTVTGPAVTRTPMRVLDGGLIEDHWGVPRQPMTVRGVDRTGREWTWSYQHVHSSPLGRASSVQEIDAYERWPSTDIWDYAAIAQACKQARQSGYAVVFGGDRLDRTAQLKPATYLRGVEEFLSDLVLEPAMAESILEHIVEYYMAYNERAFEAAAENIDIFFMGDDMGTQDSLWVSPKMYRRFFKKNFRRFNDLAHRYGLRTMYHTCGNVTDLVPDFIECGLDILQSLQPRAMDLAFLKQEYGRHLSFQGGIDIQHTMPHGTPDDVRQEVRNRAQTLGPGGGYIFCTAHNLLPDVPTENIVALFEAYQDYGPLA